MTFKYETIRERMAGLPRQTSTREREIEWIVSQRLGVSRGHRGHVEIFIGGPELHPTLAALRDNIDYQTWYGQQQHQFNANRLLLPSADYFEQAAAFICIELIDAGVEHDPAGAFASKEPIIDVWLQQLQLTNQAVLGLAGELLVFEALMSIAPTDRLLDLLASWLGYTHSTRDFEIPPIGIEIKTTTRGTSRHHINNPDQLELGRTSGGTAETNLFLASIGLQWADQPEGAWTLPLVVDRLLEHLNKLAPSQQKEAHTELLSKIEQYGGDNKLGYNHLAMRDSPRYNRPFGVEFARLYDVGDPAIKVLRLSDLSGFDNVDPGSVSYQVRLPRKVNGDLNPQNGFQTAASHVLTLAGWT